MTPIAARELTYCDDSGREQTFWIKITSPKREGESWSCEYELEAPVSLIASAYGEDSLQALIMALHAVQAHLNTPDLRSKIRWLGEPLFDFLSLPKIG